MNHIRTGAIGVGPDCCTQDAVVETVSAVAYSRAVDRVAPPPAPPVGNWRPLIDASGGAGYLSVYLSEPLARYPVRHVIRPADNKSDPNIETATYGLFSTCERQMRAKIVREGRPNLFLITTHRQSRSVRSPGRVLSGYYELAWFTESIGGSSGGDYALAASKIRFVDPVPLEALPEPARSVCIPRFRTIRPIDGPIASVLKEIINDSHDRTDRYLSELHRVEQIARHRSGYAYPSWGQVESFSWTLAARYLGQVAAPSGRPPSVPATGRWRCSSCDFIIESKALLKSCPVCKSMGTLNPETSR